MQLFARFKKILRRGFRATINFLKFKVALNPFRRILKLRVLLAGLIVAMVTYSACKESRVRQPGAGGFYDRASEFRA